jgi:hypothetical protein
MPILLKIQEKLPYTNGDCLYALRQRSHEFLVGNYLRPAAEGVLGSVRHAPRLPKLEPGILQAVLLLAEYRLAPLLPAGAIDQNANRKGFGIRREAPYTSGFSRDVSQRSPPGDR